MKKKPTVYMFISLCLVKWRDAIFYPLKGMPRPDFNNEYDSTML